MYDCRHIHRFVLLLVNGYDHVLSVCFFDIRSVTLTWWSCKAVLTLASQSQRKKKNKWSTHNHFLADVQCSVSQTGTDSLTFALESKGNTNLLSLHKWTLFCPTFYRLRQNGQPYAKSEVHHCNINCTTYYLIDVGYGSQPLPVLHC